jgi:hypothetical protein
MQPLRLAARCDAAVATSVGRSVWREGAAVARRNFRELSLAALLVLGALLSRDPLLRYVLLELARVAVFGVMPVFVWVVMLTALVLRAVWRGLRVGVWRVVDRGT